MQKSEKDQCQIHLEVVNLQGKYKDLNDWNMQAYINEKQVLEQRPQKLLSLKSKEQGPQLASWVWFHCKEQNT